MNADLSLMLGTGAAAVLFAATALVLLVRADLTRAERGGALLSGGGQWFLGAALGIGVIAFSIKLVIILTLSNFPDQTIQPLIPSAEERGAPSLGADEPGDGPGGSGHYVWRALPAVVPEPADNPTDPAKVALGERLFHDTVLSRDGTISCASCHDVRGGAGADGRPTSVGITGVAGKRNAPTVWNAAYQARLFWDGRAGSLEEQAMGPPLNPDEMGMPSAAAIEAAVASRPGYRAAFAAAFGDDAPITFGRVAQAIAAYERTLVTGDSPYDRFVRGDGGALSAEQKRGMALFQSLGCVMCHAGPNFSGASLIGPRNPYAALMTGRSPLARSHGLDQDRGRAAPGAAEGVWRIPSLRNVALTAPYFHNGAVTDLAEAVRVMATAQLGATLSDDAQARRVPRWSPEHAAFVGDERLVLGRRDIDDIVAFLKALSSDTLAARPGR
jgi:cytochrome c peroxidase